MTGRKDLPENNLQAVEEQLIPVITGATPEHSRMWDEIKSMTKEAFRRAGLSWIARTFLMWKITRAIEGGLKKGQSLFEIETGLRDFFGKRIDLHDTKIPNYRKRAKRNFEKVKDHIVGDTVLDLGAGDGFLGEEIRDQMSKEVKLVDVIDYNYSSLPLMIYGQDGEIPLDDRSVDTSIMYVVLHHADDPEHVISEAARVTRRRFIILEGYAEDPDVLLRNSFIDWFFNRVIRDADINVPLNYLPQAEWEKIFNRHGFSIAKAIDMGIDEPVAPEHHIMYVVDRVDG